ncbi:MAG: CheR family methyltransferase [Bradymonadia bacterium]
MAPQLNRAREFPYTRRDFDALKTLIKQHTGIHLEAGKHELVYGRLARRVRALSMDSFAQYVSLLEGGHDEELLTCINAITTNITSFYRHPKQFEHLQSTLIPARLASGARRLRFWSAGCSTGEEPYTMAMTIRGALEKAQRASVDARILATDLDTNVLEQAARGIYPTESIDQIGAERTRRWWLRGRGSASGSMKIKPELRHMITFNHLNLMGTWPMHGPFDAIFCRNVVIYFDAPTKAALFDRFIDLLAPGGALYLGSSESLQQSQGLMKSASQGIYVKETNDG